MKIKEHLAKAPLLRPVVNPYSVKYYVFVDGKIKEQLCVVSKQRNFGQIAINYVRLKFWLKKGLRVDPTITFFSDKILNIYENISEKG